MKTTARLAALLASILLVSGCTHGLRPKDRTVRDPVQLPSAPSLAEPGATLPAIPNMSGPSASPLSGAATGRPAGMP